MTITKKMRQELANNGKDTQEDFKKYGWKTGFNYKADNCFIAQSKEFPDNIMINLLFLKNIEYAEKLYWGDEMKELLPPKVYQEQQQWRQNGISTYVSIILYHLLLKDKVCYRGTMRYVQGYIMYQLPDTQEVKRHIHSWLMIKDRPLDFTVANLRHYGFQFEKDMYIMGEIPNGLTMVGYTETEKTIQNLTKKFAKASNMNEEEWINFHYMNARILFNNENRKQNTLF